MTLHKDVFKPYIMFSILTEKNFSYLTKTTQVVWPFVGKKKKISKLRSRIIRKAGNGGPFSFPLKDKDLVFGSELRAPFSFPLKDEDLVIDSELDVSETENTPLTLDNNVAETPFALDYIDFNADYTYNGKKIFAPRSAPSGGANLAPSGGSKLAPSEGSELASSEGSELASSEGSELAISGGSEMSVEAAKLATLLDSTISESIVPELATTLAAGPGLIAIEHAQAELIKKIIEEITKFTAQILLNLPL